MEGGVWGDGSGVTRARTGSPATAARPGPAPALTHVKHSGRVGVRTPAPRGVCGFLCVDNCLGIKRLFKKGGKRPLPEKNEK